MRIPPTALEPYHALFTRYVVHTDGKAAIADALAPLARDLAKPRVLDVGGGDGAIAARLVNDSEHVVVVEPSDEFAPSHAGRASHSYDFFQGTIQEFEAPAGSFDLILLSYVLESIPLDEWPAVLQKLESLRSRDGVIVGVTHVEGCAWEAFATAVDRRIGPSGARAGGACHIISELRSHGYDAVIDRVLDTSIWGENLDELYDVLAFFFRNEPERYEYARSELRGELARFAREAPGRTSLPVIEALFRIWPRPAGAA